MLKEEILGEIDLEAQAKELKEELKKIRKSKYMDYPNWLCSKLII